MLSFDAFRGGEKATSVQASINRAILVRINQLSCQYLRADLIGQLEREVRLFIVPFCIDVDR
jgi:hypothetical protein